MFISNLLLLLFIQVIYANRIFFDDSAYRPLELTQTNSKEWEKISYESWVEELKTNWLDDSKDTKKIFQFNKNGYIKIENNH